MKKITLLAGIIFSLLLTSCSTDVNDFEADALEQSPAKTEYIGHAWVADGYEKVTGKFYNLNNDTYFYASLADHVHMNWGWGGYKNGWFDYDTWEDLNGIVDPDVNFIYVQQMIHNITPN